MFTLEINTDNAAFEGDRPGAEIARILRRLADQVEESETDAGKFNLRDYNGNTVGHATLKPYFDGRVRRSS